jgi:hypothetical protein
MKKSNFPCKCGHYQNVHIDSTRGPFPICMYCMKNSNHEFQLDNLSLIEDGLKDLETAQASSTLPEKPNLKWADDFVYDVYSDIVKKG